MSPESDQYSVWQDFYLVFQGIFYLAQGYAMGALFFLTAFLSFLDLDPTGRIIVQAVIWLPWYLKIIFGILSDNFSIGKYGRRKPYIFIAAISGAIGWFTLGVHTSFGILLIVSGILASLGTSMSDATIDALAVDVTPPRRRGAMQGVSWGARGIGVGVSAILVGLAADTGYAYPHIWFAIYATPGMAISAACFLVLLFKEIPLPDDFVRTSLREYGGYFKRKEVQITTLFQILAGAGISILAIMQTFLEEDLGFSNTTIGIVFLIFSIGMFLGSVIFGFLGDRVAFKRTLPITSIFYIIIIVSVLFVNLFDSMTAMIIFFLVGIANGGYEATQMRIGMDYSPPEIGGTMYNFYNSISNLGSIAIGPIFIALMVESIGSYQIGWQIASIFLLLSIIPGLMLTKYAVVGEKESEFVGEKQMGEVPGF